VNVERATHADLAGMLAIERASHPRPWSEAGLAEEIARAEERGETWVVRVDGRIVAYVVVWFVVDEMQIQNVTTDPAERRKGYAAELVRCALHRAEARGCRRITLEVRAGNTAAIALYEAFAFARVGVRPRYYTNGDDAVLMERSVA
jgi:ribosomal-protein-alanine N-acetyltransferase